MNLHDLNTVARLSQSRMCVTLDWDSRATLRFIVLFCFLLLSPRAFADAAVEFNRDVRPILSDRCFACHGPDEQSREADLRLDDRLAATNKDGGAIVPGNADASELIRRIESKDESEIMPPPEHGKALTAEEIKLLRRWIDQGAKYQQHWSFSKLTRPKVPSLQSGQPENAIDAFIRDRLTTEELDPAKPADPRTLARRLSFDLTGLPPNPQLVQQFLDQPTDDAYADLVERFLRSPHYGERMAMYWLDLVRYADTLGYHGDQPRSVSPYRDYVINAFDDNKPFVQHEAESLAGGLDDLAQRATVYHHLFQQSGGNHVFPLLAAHGALWARSYFRRGMKLGWCFSWQSILSPATRRRRLKALSEFADAFRDINRRVCIDTYTSYHFTRQFGDHPAASQFVPEPQLVALNRCHTARDKGEDLSTGEKREIFRIFFLNEQ